jgi:hypothetical protein
MSTKLTTLLDQLQAEKAAAQQEAAMVKNAYLTAMRSTANALLYSYLGHYADDLLPLISEPDEEIVPGTYKSSALRLTWRMHSHEQNLALTIITWCECWPNSLSFDVQGKETTNAATDLGDLLLLMRSAYPAYKAKLDELAAAQAVGEAHKRSALIANLAWPANWRHGVSGNQIQELYTQLCALGEADLAREKLAAYRTSVTEAHQRAQQAHERKAAYEAALAEYHQQMEIYQQACKEWAEKWQPQLWQPHTLWRVRYTPYHDEASVEPTIEAVCTLDTPEDIIANLKPVAYIDTVDIFGHVTESVAIATYLDATPLRFINPPPLTDHIERYHRRYPAGDYCVHVPPFILSEPGPAPVRPLAPQRDSDQW